MKLMNTKLVGHSWKVTKQHLHDLIIILEYIMHNREAKVCIISLLISVNRKEQKLTNHCVLQAVQLAHKVKVISNNRGYN